MSNQFVSKNSSTLLPIALTVLLTLAVLSILIFPFAGFFFGAIAIVLAYKNNKKALFYVSIVITVRSIFASIVVLLLLNTTN